MIILITHKHGRLLGAQASAHLWWEGKRQKAKTKRQKWQMDHRIEHFVGIVTRHFIFAFCLLPFAFLPQVG